MSVKALKFIWWSLLLLSLGGSALFLLIVLTDHNAKKFASDFYLWPIITVPVAVISILRLRKCYALEPLGSGFWHLSLTDSIAISIFFGLCLSIFKPVFDELFLPIGLAYSAALGATAAIGMLFSARKQWSNWRLKYAYALGFSLTLVGGLVTGGFAVVLIAISIRHGYLFTRPLKYVLGVEDYFGGDRWIILLLRTGLILALIGISALAYTFILNRQKASQSEADSASGDLSP